MPLVRALNRDGIEKFREFLQMIRNGAEFQDSPALLFVETYSIAVTQSARIERKRFGSKFEAAKYLAEALQPIDRPEVMEDAGLWSWLALFYFDQLSPLDAEGRRRPREDYHYIPSGKGWGRERHLLAGPYRILLMHGENARLMLHPAVHQHGQFVYDLGVRRELITNRGLIEAIDLLYWDRKKKRPKTGATTASRPGNLRRLITVIDQLGFNYDLHGMTGPEIIGLLPPEFDAWRE